MATPDDADRRTPSSRSSSPSTPPTPESSADPSAATPGDRTPGRMPGALAWIAAVAASVVICLVLGMRLTDGDSCVYGALAHDMAAGSWRAWVAPQWAFDGRWTCFHEHPPGAMWPAALVEMAGADPLAAPLVANVLWQFAALAGVLALARPFVGRNAAWIAGAAFLLSIPALRYADRFALEFPIAAAAAWTIAAALRLGRSPWWTPALGVALAAAFLVRGAFAGVPLVLLGVLVCEPSLRPPPLRLLGGLAIAAALVLGFDLLHAAATGHAFWTAYLDRQVFPSLEPGGTAHSIDGHPWGYVLSRFATYALPWVLVPIARLVRGPRPPTSPAAWRVAAVWIALTLAAAIATTRPASRYLFGMLPALAVLAALGVGPGAPPRLTRWAAVLALLAIPVTSALKEWTGERRTPWETAGLLDTFRASDLRPREVRGPFAPREDGHAAILRFHLGVPVLPDGPDAPPDARRWVPAGSPPLPGARVLVATPLGSLVEPR